ncbi:MAG: hypothetical protein OXU26_07120 [Acidobacteriota bacterium]|nr:hypothetical protein [Acidobacteriota bacterium]
MNMRTRNWSALTVSLVLVGTVFLTPSSQEAAERPEVHFVSHGTTPAPVEYVTTTFSQDSTSTLTDLVSVFRNISDEPVIALQVTWTIHDRSRNTRRVTDTTDTQPFGDEGSLAGKQFLPGSTIEVATHAVLKTPAAIERIEVTLDFVDTAGVRRPGVEWPAYGNVWPDRNPSWLTLHSRRVQVATFRSFLVREADSKGLGRIEEILQMERERMGRIVPLTAKASPPESETCRSHPNLEPGDPPDKMVVESIEICGKFVGDPALLKELINSKIETKPGDRFDPDVLKKDFRAVWSLGRVHTMRVGLNKGKRGVIVAFEVEERL